MERVLAFLREIRETVSSSELWLDTRRLVLGNGSVQIIGLIAAPITARIFVPEDAGAAAIVINTGILFSGLMTLRIENAVCIARSELERGALILASIFFVGPVGLLIYLVLFLFISSYPGATEMIGSSPGLIVVCAVSLSAYNLFYQVVISIREYESIVRQKYAKTVTQVGTQLGAGAWLGGSATILVTGYVIGNITACALSGKRAFGLVLNAFRSRSRFVIRQAVHRHRKFPLFTSWSSLVDSLGPLIPLYLLAAFYGSESAGLFRMSQTLVIIPISALSSAMSNVYTAEAASMISKNRPGLRKLFNKMTLVGVLVGVVLIAGCQTLPWYIDIVLGREWQQVGSYAAILSVPASFALIASFSTNYQMLKKNHWESLWTVSRIMVLAALVFYVDSNVHDEYDVLIIISSILSFFYIVLIITNLKLVIEYDRDIQRVARS